MIFIQCRRKNHLINTNHHSDCTSLMDFFQSLVFYPPSFSKVFYPNNMTDKRFPFIRKYEFTILFCHEKRSIHINHDTYKNILWKWKFWRYTVSFLKHVSFEGRKIDIGKFQILKISPPDFLQKCKSIIGFIYQKKIEHQIWIREVTIFFREHVSKR